MITKYKMSTNQNTMIQNATKINFRSYKNTRVAVSSYLFAIRAEVLDVEGCGIKSGLRIVRDGSKSLDLFNLSFVMLEPAP
jgi:hypothetical protein